MTKEYIYILFIMRCTDVYKVFDYISDLIRYSTFNSWNKKLCLFLSQTNFHHLSPELKYFCLIINREYSTVCDKIQFIIFILKHVSTETTYVKLSFQVCRSLKGFSARFSCDLLDD